MNKDKYVFAQFSDFLDHNKFRRLVDKYNGDFHVKHFTCWHQLLTLMFGQLSGRESLRDLTTVLDAHKTKCYHLGLGSSPASRNTLSVANQNRDYHVFEEYAFFMMDEARRKCATDIFMLGGKAYAFDSTTIPLCLSVFHWAKFRSRKGGVKAHVLYDLETHVPSFYHITTASVHDSKAMSAIPYESGSYYVFDRGYNAFAELFRINRLESFFVVRAKQNLKFKCVKWKRRMPENVLGDAEIEFAEEASFKKYPEKLRLVRFHDNEQNRDFAFLTNDFSLPALKVADLYRNRWQVELFFKWLKQHLKIKKFWGVTENAVRIQMSVAIITYCLVAVVRNELKLERSTYELLQILSVSLTDKTPMRELFEKQEMEALDVPVTPFLPGLFD
ncbi:MAG: IS4 family transposase [Victivallales bacterium]|nr:IS4 family transposase [Victivallales bacterium]MBR5023488.1 IS4 family transposase [Victivallales bacterium]